MRMYNSCGRPNACCAAVRHDEENDVYVIFDEEKDWKTGEIFFEELLKLRDIINTIEKKRKD